MKRKLSDFTVWCCESLFVEVAGYMDYLRCLSNESEQLPLWGQLYWLFPVANFVGIVLTLNWSRMRASIAYLTLQMTTIHKAFIHPGFRVCCHLFYLSFAWWSQNDAKDHYCDRSGVLLDVKRASQLCLSLRTDAMNACMCFVLICDCFSWSVVESSDHLL